jgi:hypothetical protein
MTRLRRVAFGLPTQHPIFGLELPLLAIRVPMVFVELCGLLSGEPK